jgi:putative ABC transport system permease protein
MAPDQPFSYRFVDDSFRRMYEAESRTGGIIMVFAILAILVSCLGLFGLSTFVVEQRTKEIGIRKVLGANIADIVGLLSKRFLLLVFIGIILAIPLAWYFLNGWLANFAYRVELDWSLFLAAATVAILIAFFTVSFQSIKAAIMSPSRALRSE